MKECWSYYESGTAEGEAPRSSDGIRFFEPLGELVGVMSRGWGNGFWFVDLRRKVAGGPPESEIERVGMRSGLGYGSRVCCGGARYYLGH